MNSVLSEDCSSLLYINSNFSEDLYNYRCQISFWYNSCSMNTGCSGFLLKIIECFNCRVHLFLGCMQPICWFVFMMKPICDFEIFSTNANYELACDMQTCSILKFWRFMYNRYNNLSVNSYVAILFPRVCFFIIMDTVCFYVERVHNQNVNSI